MGNNSVPKFIFRLSRFPVYRGSVLGRFYCILDISYSRCSLSAEKHGIPFHNNCVTKRYYTKCSRWLRSILLPHNAIRKCHQQLHNACLISQQHKVFGAREKLKLSEFQGQPLIMKTPRDISCKARLYSQK